jgi:C1A family cysteine protease
MDFEKWGKIAEKIPEYRRGGTAGMARKGDMMMKIPGLSLRSISCLLASASLHLLYADVERGIHGTGLRIPTQEEIKYLEQAWPKIIKVKPNKIGAARIQNYLESQGQLLHGNLIGVSADEEITTNRHPNLHAFAEEIGVLPPYVDNSTLPCFPPIGDQGQEGSCVAFASTYYHATHEVGLTNGYNNKTSNTYILSPKWTYNMIDNGGDNGAFPPDAYVLLSQNGAITNVKFPYVVGDVRSWDLNTQDWIDAMSNRTTPPNYVTGIGGPSQNLTQIKQLLNNGHVLTFATFVESWQYSTIPQNPQSGADNRFAGQHVATWMNGQLGGHFVTIVGYNDNIWVDINGNGQVDPGEMGAFLVANSWGSNWGNNGFIWVAYDAFLSTSTVSNGPSKGRVALASALNNDVVNVSGKAQNYKPVIVAEFGLTSAARSQISISGGISTPSMTMPSQIFKSGAINFQGGPFGFDGSMDTSTAVFALDLTDLVNLNATTNDRFYLTVDDHATGNPTVVQSYSLIDYSQGTAVNAPNLPQTIDNMTATLHIDHTVIPPMPPSNPLTVAINAPINNSTVSCSVPVSVSVVDNTASIATIELLVDGALIIADNNVPYIFLLDTTKLTNGVHTLTVTAKDSANNMGTASVTMQVHNGCN